jgi:protein phosphatase
MPLKPVKKSDLIVAAGSHPGETGKNNEDRYALHTYQTPRGEPVTLAVVCDGVGGHRAGEVASDLAVQTIVEHVARGDGGDYQSIFTEAVTRASDLIAERAESNLELKGMATTCAIALVQAQRLYTAYVGDSRVYLYRRARDEIRQTSVDHTWLQAAVEHGLIKPEDAPSHPNQHVLLRHLGGKDDAQPDFRLKLADDEPVEQSEANQGLRLEPGDTVLVCSDGLSDLVKGDEIVAVLRKQKPEPAVDELIRLARQRGGHDNITLVVLSLPGG